MKNTLSILVVHFVFGAAVFAGVNGGSHPVFANGGDHGNALGAEGRNGKGTNTGNKGTLKGGGHGAGNGLRAAGGDGVKGFAGGEGHVHGLYADGVGSGVKGISGGNGGVRGGLRAGADGVRPAPAKGAEGHGKARQQAGDTGVKG